MHVAEGNVGCLHPAGSRCRRTVHYQRLLCPDPAGLHLQEAAAHLAMAEASCLEIQAIPVVEAAVGCMMAFDNHEALPKATCHRNQLHLG